jgi:hypothetical protein
MNSSGSPHAPGSGSGAGAHGPSPDQIASFTEAGIRKQFTADLEYAICNGVSLFLTWLVAELIASYVFNMLLLGILISQVWHWAAWTKREKLFIRVIVVCLYNISHFGSEPTDPQYWVLFFSLVSGAVCTTWFYQIFVVHYGKFSPFIDSDCKHT